MREYEIVYIFRSVLSNDEIEGRLERYHEKLLSHPGSEITAIEHWGKRQLAYPIAGNDNGYYVVAQFRTIPAALPEFERLLKLDDELLRHLVVLSEGEFAPLGASDEGAGESAEAPAEAPAEVTAEEGAAAPAGSEVDATPAAAEEAEEGTAEEAEEKTPAPLAAEAETETAATASDGDVTESGE
ncbi:MAG: 30S ribosomal protein S6 [Gemmatimonadota bacterium]